MFSFQSVSPTQQRVTTTDFHQVTITAGQQGLHFKEVRPATSDLTRDLNPGTPDGESGVYLLVT